MNFIVELNNTMTPKITDDRIKEIDQRMDALDHDAQYRVCAWAFGYIWGRLAFRKDQFAEDFFAVVEERINAETKDKQ